jgi:hypothetical protein
MGIAWLRVVGVGIPLLCAGGCATETPPPEGDGSDGGIPVGTDSEGSGPDASDSGTSDSGASDSGATDSGASDSSASDSAASDADSGLPLFDVGTWDPIEGCPAGEGGSTEFSIIWIANSPEGTVSKIDTVTAVELARYRTGPGSPDPSRTSVNLRGDVAVSNRRGSITKIAARLEDCVDLDGDGEIQTSQGPDDVLDWGEDECVLWHYETTFDASVSGSTGGPRATAWTGGRFDEESCQTVDIELWIGWRNQPESSVTIAKLDGDDGSLVGQTVVDQWPSNWGHGPYGGAADAEGNLWALGTSGTMFKIDGTDFSVSRWDNPQSHVMYGIALDAAGTPWIAGYDGNLWKFDLQAETWEDMGDAGEGPSRMRGLAIDTQGHAWIAGNNPCGLVQFDTTTETYVDEHIALPDCDVPVGVSIDADGMVWVVDRNVDRAYKVDPVTHATDTVEDLVDPYTYSDMTGAGLNLVVNPPA